MSVISRIAGLRIRRVGGLRYGKSCSWYTNDVIISQCGAQGVINA